MYSDDSYFYDQYDLSCYEEQERPPLISKKSRLLAAVVQNHVGVLEDLLDSPKWYNVMDRSGLTLLQIAIVRNNKEVFDYMLSIPDFPVDFVNSEGQTALVVALGNYVNEDVKISEHFAYQLVKKGASIDVICCEGNTLLHCALEWSYDKVAILLIEKGVDVNTPNNEGCTPLKIVLFRSKGMDEVVPALLMHGAMPSVDTFKRSIMGEAPFFVQEMLFLYIFDECSDVELPLHVILKLAEKKSPLFHELLRRNFTASPTDHIGSSVSSLLRMDINYLKIIVEKFSNEIRKPITKGGFLFILYEPKLDVRFLENLEYMLSTDLKSVVISLFSSFPHNHLLRSRFALTEMYCYLLSYGLTITEHILMETYSTYGYCELFKILLHMDIIILPTTIKIWPKLLYDVSLNIEHFFDHPDLYSWDLDTIKELRKYFAHPVLKDLYEKSVDDDDSSKVLQWTEVPLLTELARNVLRKHFIGSLQIRTSRKFYTLLNSLPIGTTFKKIISFEMQLYRKN